MLVSCVASSKRAMITTNTGPAMLLHSGPLLQRRIHVNAVDTMFGRNKEFAAKVSSAGTPMLSLPAALPDVKALIITCADMRVDPAHILGVGLGEAVVMRNIGGRITPGLVEQIGLLGRIAQVAGAAPGGGRRISHRHPSTYRLRHHAACRRPRSAGELFPNRGE